MARFNSPPWVLAQIKRAEVRGRQQRAAAAVLAGQLFARATEVNDPIRAEVIRAQARTLAAKVGAKFDETAPALEPDPDADRSPMRTLWAYVDHAFYALFPVDPEVRGALDAIGIALRECGAVDDEGDFFDHNYGPDYPDEDALEPEDW